MPDRTAHPRPMPRLLSPRLSIGPRWLAFCRSGFARDLRASVRALGPTAALVSAVVTFYVGVNAAAVVYTSFGGVL